MHPHHPADFFPGTTLIVLVAPLDTQSYTAERQLSEPLDVVSVPNLPIQTGLRRLEGSALLQLERQLSARAERMEPLQLLSHMRTWPRALYYARVPGPYAAVWRRVRLSDATVSPCPSTLTCQGHVPWGETPELLDDVTWSDLLRAHVDRDGYRCPWVMSRGHDTWFYEPARSGDAGRTALVFALARASAAPSPRWNDAARVLADYDREHGIEHFDLAQSLATRAGGV